MNAAVIAAALGRPLHSGAWWRCPCPVHKSRGATLALRDGERGLIAKCFAGCDPRDVLAELRCRGLIGGGVKSIRPEPPRETGNDRGAVRRIEIARSIWEAARDARGTPVADYLAGRGIITIPPPPSLRWASSLRRQDGSAGPAMVAVVEHVERGAVGVHRTWLARDLTATQWRRLDRASLGPIGGSAVQLAAAGELLMVAEGIETALSPMQATALPAWAALSASGLVALALPHMVRTVIILTDHDVNGAGERAARAAATRWLAEGRGVRIAMPPEPGTDFNDVLLGRAYAKLRHVAA